MDNLKEAKRNKIEMHKEQLETYEKHAENLSERKGHSDQMFEFMKSQVQDISDQMAIESAQQDSQYRFQEAFREQVEAPTTEIKKELYKDIEEMEAESQNVRKAAEQAKGFDVAEDVATRIKSELQKSSEEFDAMTRGARDIIGKNDQNVHDNQLRILSKYK